MTTEWTHLKTEKKKNILTLLYSKYEVWVLIKHDNLYVRTVH